MKTLFEEKGTLKGKKDRPGVGLTTLGPRRGKKKKRP